MIGFVLSRRSKVWRKAAVLASALLALCLLTQASGCEDKSSQTSTSAKGRIGDKRVYASYQKDDKTVRVVEVFFIGHKTNDNKVYVRARNLTDQPVTLTLTTTVGSKDPVKWNPVKLPVGSKAYVDIGPVTVSDGKCLSVRLSVDQGDKTRKSKAKDGSKVVCVAKSKNQDRT